MHCDILKIQDGFAIVEKLNCKMMTIYNKPFSFYQRQQSLNCSFFHNAIVNNMNTEKLKSHIPKINYDYRIVCVCVRKLMLIKFNFLFSLVLLRPVCQPVCGVPLRYVTKKLRRYAKSLSKAPHKTTHAIL